MHTKHFKIFFGMILVAFFVIVCRLFYVQIIDGGKYSGISDDKRIRTIGIDTLRGTIYDRNGRMLAVDRHSFELTVIYKKLFNTYSCFKRNILPKLSTFKNKELNRRLCKECHLDNSLWVEELAELLEIPYSDIFERTSQIVEKVEKIKRNVERRNKRKIHIKEETVPYSIASNIAWEKIVRFEVKMQDLPGIRVDVKPVRWYPQRDLAAHIIGYVGKFDKKEIKDNNFKKRWFNGLGKNNKSKTEYFAHKALAMDTFVGKSGIERVYNSSLMGIPGDRFEEITLDTLKVNKLILERPPISGNNIFLTIDSRIQGIAEKVLGERRGSIVVMNPLNGEVLAMATFPRYDLNNLRVNFPVLNKNPNKPFLNRPIQGVLSPGSVFKVITAVAGLEENKVNEDTHFTCYGSLKTGGGRFRCHSKYGHGLLNIEEAIQYSCNVFFFEVAKMLGSSLLKKWVSKFDFGSVTGIELPYEKKGNIPASNAKYETMNMSIGQGAMLVTPVQVTKMMAMIANGGWYIKPHILKKITDYEGKVLFNNKLRHTNKIGISEKNLDIIKRSLRRVVTAGTARNVGLNELHVAGKTGTTQTARENENHAWFAGYAPFDNPKYCFTVVIERTPGHGADVAGPIVQKLLSELEV
ncbi:MAG: penicillin-binding protein 2 [Candidatus Scalinduaceae bacterium]